MATMKVLTITVFSFFMLMTTHSQILKKLGKELEGDARWKVRMKANKKMDQAIDTLLEQPKKAIEKKKHKNDSSPTTPSPNNSSLPSKNKEEKNKHEEKNEMEVYNGFITVSLSSYETFSGGTIAIKGSSFKYGNVKDVNLSIGGPGVKTSEALPLKEDNSFNKTFQASKAGDYTITVSTTDNKAKAQAQLKVSDLYGDDNWTEQNKEETQKSFELLKRQTDKVRQEIADKDKAELDKKMEKVKKDVDQLLEFFDELGNAKKNLAKTKAELPAPLALKLSQLNDVLYDQRNQMKRLRETADHEPYDNTVCEKLVMVNEASAAFETLTSWTRAPLVILTEIVKDNTPIGSKLQNQSAANDIAPVVAQPAKIFALSKLYSEKLTMDDFTNGIVQYATDFLLKRYCGQLKGTVKHDYEIIYRNQLGTVWWKYKYLTQSTLNLRYPKTSGGGNIVKMKGSIEGNATKFEFYQDVEQQEDFKKEMKGRAKLNPVELVHPIALPVSTSKFDGLGAVARGLGTPCYFYIPVDAEFDRQANKITLFLNEAMIDFSGMVKYKYAFWAIAAGVPIITFIDFPVNKAKLTLNAVVSKNNEFDVIADSKNNLSFTGTGTREIGNDASPIQHKINFTVSAKSQ